MLVLISLMVLAGPPSVAGGGTVYDFELLGEGAVIATAAESGNPANPSVIRVPGWVPSGQRPSPNANYYMYYGSHTDHYIRMRWAETLDGPWTRFDLGGTYNGHRREGVFDTDADPTRDSYGHVFAPDVHVDDIHQRIIMYYHGRNQSSTTTLTTGQSVPQKHDNFVATSKYGLNFNDPAHAGGEPGYGPVTVSYDGITREVLVASDYQHVFVYKGNYYSVSKRGILEKAPDPANPWAPVPDDPGTSKVEPFSTVSWVGENVPSDLWLYDAHPGGQEDYMSPGATFLASSAFADHPNNPHPGTRIFSEAADDALRINHTSLNLLPEREQLEVFFYVRATGPTDLFDDIYRIVYDLSDPDFGNWTVATHPTTGEYLFDVVVTDDEISAAVRAIRPRADPDDFADPISLGAPGVFVDIDGGKYLFYTYYSAANGGINSTSEGQISAIRLIPIHTFSDWIAGFPDVGVLNGFGDDPDQDGLTNGLENFFGTAPDTVTAGGLVAGRYWTGEGNAFTFTHPESDAPAHDVSPPDYQWSTALNTFHGDGETVGTTSVSFSRAPNSPAPGTTTVTATITGPVPDTFFVRLEITHLPD